ncbi:MAG: Gfo/Idh/MocA family protein, partial [Flavisolibacter sp.]
RRHHVPKWYDDADNLVNDPHVNAIYIATPPSSHEMYTIKAMQAGKPVYLEKPMTTDVISAKRIATAVKQTKMKLCVAHYRRQQPIFLKIKSLIDKKVIGEPRLVQLRFWQPHQSGLDAKTEENWRLNPAISGGGLFHDLSPHQLDLMIYFFGKPKQSSGISYNAAGLYDADDSVSGQIVFENNVLFNGSWCFTIDEKADLCEIVGTKGKLRFSIFEHQPLVITIEGREEIIHFDKLQHVQQPMIEKVTQYFLGKGSNPCTADEGVEVMRLIDSFVGRYNLQS